MPSTLEVVLCARMKVTWTSPVKLRLIDYVVINATANRHVLPGLSQQAASEETGISATLVRQHFAELVAWHVLERIDGAGSRPHAYRINLNFDEWRVPWLGSTPPASDDETPKSDYLMKRRIALAEIECFARPPVVQEPLVVARPGARQTKIAGLSGARQTRVAPRATPSSTELLRNSVSHEAQTDRPSEPTSGANQVLGAIFKMTGDPVLGKFKTQVCELVNGADVTELVDRIQQKPGLRITGYIDLVRQHLAEIELPAVLAPEPPPLRPAPPLEPGAPPPADLRSWLEPSHDRVAAACKNGDGGSES